MSIQIVEIAQPSVIDTVAVAQPSTVAVVEVRQGPASEGGGGNSITSATTSDGTADLLLANVETATAEVTGTLIAPHIHGNLAGSVYAHVRAGEALEKGDPVYVSSSHGSGATLIAEVSKADASNAAKMPAVGIMDADVALHANGHMVIVGTITELDTDGLAINAELYVASGGGMTATPPTARAQPVARVERANANNGAILVKVNGLSASDATASTLVRRTSGGGASIAGIVLSGLNTNSGSYSQVGGTNFNVATTTAANLTATGSGTVTVSGAAGTTISGGILTFSPSGFFYGIGAASAHRTALGSGATGDLLFQALTPAAARETLEINRTRVTQAADLSNETTTFATTDLVLTLVGGVDYLIRGVFDLESFAGGTGFKLNLSTSQNIDIPAASGGVIGWVGSFAGATVATTTTLTVSNFLAQTLSGTRRAQAEFRLRLVATGTVTIRFAQNAGNTAPASLFKAGSWLASERL